MKRTILPLLAVLAVLAVGSCRNEIPAPELCIVPNPASITGGGEEVLLPETGEPDLQTRICSRLGDEEYVLDTRGGKILLRGGSQAGLFYGRQTLMQIVSQLRAAGADSIPGMKIQDKPAFAYRGAHLDCCRHIFTIDEIKTYIDILALHKLNVLHWHLTDDQGWRAEIKRYPRLTEVGSIRKETLVGHYGSDTYDGTPYGGYYTQDEMREIVRYAAERFITVIPEIEMPGHASAALASYPELGCRGKDYPYIVQTTWGVFPEVFCAGNPETVTFLERVLDEICDVFPSEYIHIGGDEAPRSEWENCPLCQAQMRVKGYTREAELQSYLITTIETYLAGKGRKIIGWDEILDGGVSQSATVMSWRGPKGGIAAAKLGNDVIMTPNSHYYLDYYQTADPAGNSEPLGIGGCLPLRKCYSFDPYDQLSDDEKSHIKGIQANLWTEYIASFDHVQHMLLPRLAALSEVAWSNTNRTSYESFVQRISTALLPLYAERGYIWAPFAFEGIE